MDKEYIAKLPKGQTVYTILRHVSKSGMTRVIELVIPYDCGKTEYRRRILALRPSGFDYKYDTKRMGYKVRGCGMDMGFNLVYELGAWATGDGYYFKQEWL